MQIGRKMIQIAELSSVKMSKNPGYFTTVCVSDESTFFLNGHIHWQNVKYGSTIHEDHT